MGQPKSKAKELKKLNESLKKHEANPKMVVKIKNKIKVAESKDNK